METELREMGLAWGEAGKVAKDRDRWRRVVATSLGAKRMKKCTSSKEGSVHYISFILITCHSVACFSGHTSTCLPQHLIRTSKHSAVLLFSC